MQRDRIVHARLHAGRVQPAPQLSPVLNLDCVDVVGVAAPRKLQRRDGKAVQRMVGFQPKPSLKGKIDAALATVA